MSVQVNTYVILGVVLPFEKGDDFEDSVYEKYEPYMDSAFEGIHHHKGLCVLYDGMNGKYIIIGRVLRKTPESGSFGAPCVVEYSKENADLIKGAIEANFGFSPEKISIIVISHFR